VVRTVAYLENAVTYVVCLSDVTFSLCTMQPGSRKRWHSYLETLNSVLRELGMCGAGFSGMIFIDIRTASACGFA